MTPSSAFRFAAALSLVLPALVPAQVLYDPAAGTLPQVQGWSYASLPVAAQLAFEDDSTQLNTQSLSQILAGFSRVAPVPLDRTVGFTLSFTLQVLAEDHGTRVDRAGTSVTVLAADRKGIELGFWSDRIWAQADAPMFTHAEEALWNVTAGLADYSLTLLGDTYTLTANGNPLLTGPVRDYTSFAGVIDPYETPNFLFFGDNTTSARASLALQRIVLTSPSALPDLTMEATALGIVVTWPTTALPLVLETTGQLGADAVWKPVTEPVVGNETRFQVSLPATESQRYFRLQF